MSIIIVNIAHTLGFKIVVPRKPFPVAQKIRVVWFRARRILDYHITRLVNVNVLLKTEWALPSPKTPIVIDMLANKIIGPN